MSLDDVLERMRSFLVPDYEYPDGRPVGCGDVARTVAYQFKRSSEHPSLITVRGQTYSKRGRRRVLSPSPLDDQTWTAHMACEYDGLVYDPIASQPLPMEEYVAEVFGDADITDTTSLHGFDV